MLKKYIESASTQGGVSAEDTVPQIAKAFDEGIHFLRDPERFKDPITNIIATSGLRLIGSRAVAVALLPELDPETLSFVVLSQQRGLVGVIALPHRFHEQVASDPILQLGATAQMIERTHLFWQGYMRGEAGLIENSRANAVEAGVVSAIMQMAQDEGVDYELTHGHMLQVLDYPDGVRSLGQGDSTGEVAAVQADHIKPTEQATSEMLTLVGSVDAVGHMSGDNMTIMGEMLRLQKSGIVASYRDLEYYLRQVGSPVFLHAIPANHYGRHMQPKDLRGEKKTEFGLGITRCGVKGSTPPSLILDDIGETYEENVEKLDRAGVFVVDKTWLNARNN